MRGKVSPQRTMIGRSAELAVPGDHPVRAVKALCDRVLREMSPDLDAMYSPEGRASLPPECLLKASVLMALYSVRSERLLCEMLSYNLLFRWFLDLADDQEPFDHSTLSKNRRRLIRHAVADRFFVAIGAEARRLQLMSEDHFSVDGTLIEAWASLKSFHPKAEVAKVQPVEPIQAPRPAPVPVPVPVPVPEAAIDEQEASRNRDVNFRGEKRSNATHASTTDPDSRLYRKGKGKEARLSFMGHALIENRHGLLVGVSTSLASGNAECEQALDLMERLPERTKPRTIGADKGYDNANFVQGCRGLGFTPHVARNDKRPGGSSIDSRTSRHAGYEISQRRRKIVEEVFGWMKTVGGCRKSRFIGLERVNLHVTITACAYNLTRIARLASEGAAGAASTAKPAPLRMKTRSGRASAPIRPCGLSSGQPALPFGRGVAA